MKDIRATIAGAILCLVLSILVGITMYMVHVDFSTLAGIYGLLTIVLIAILTGVMIDLIIIRKTLKRYEDEDYYPTKYSKSNLETFVENGKA